MIDSKKLAREQARINLTLGLYTEWYFQLDLHNLMNFLRLRLDWHAQKETRVYAEAMAKCVEAVAPMAWKSFCEHTKDGANLSKTERDVLATIVRLAAAGLPYTTILGMSEKDANRLLKKLGI
jgi:thymidylate synthase (FAD)